MMAQDRLAVVVLTNESAGRASTLAGGVVKIIHCPVAPMLTTIHRQSPTARQRIMGSDITLSA